MTRMLPTRKVGLLLVIAIIAITSSILFYGYSSVNSSKIAEIAVREIRSNTEIQASDISNSLSNKLMGISNTLRLLTNSPALQTGDDNAAKILLNQAERVENISDFYMWLDRDGKIIWISEINSTEYEKYKNADLSYRDYFIHPKNTSNAYYSSVIESNDNIRRLFISHPIMNNKTGTAPEGNATFEGVVISAIRIDHLGKSVERELSTKFDSDVSIFDRNGVILYARDQNFVGVNVFSDKFREMARDTMSNTEYMQLSKFLNHALSGNSGVEDITFNNAQASVAYNPMRLDNEFFAVLFITSPHDLASDVTSLISQQNNLSIIIILVIGIVSFFAAVITFMWNNKLQDTVNKRTLELVESNNKLVSAVEQLKLHDKMQREFINIAAHELRTPTQAILGYSELLLNNEQFESLPIQDGIHRNALRLHNLINDILDVTKIEGQSFKISKYEFNLTNEISDLVNDLNNQPGTRYQLRFSNKSNQKDIIVNGDRQRIIQVVSNLVTNSIKFTPQGTIDIETNLKDGNVIVSVRDSGTGIDKTIMEKLFSKFVTKSDSGTGLGLYIAKNIIEAHGGKIWAENNADGSGATFAFSIPLK